MRLSIWPSSQQPWSDLLELVRHHMAQPGVLRPYTPEEVASGSIYYNYGNRSGAFLSEDLSGTSVFYKSEEGKLFHTYSSYGRGGEELLGSYRLIDLTPKGREENGPTFTLGDWVRHHDRYQAPGFVDPTGRYREVAVPDPVPTVAS